TIQGGTDDSVVLDGAWTDNGDGTYTATASGSSVTLEITGASVDLSAPAAFGLANLQSDDIDSEEAFMFSHDAELPQLAMMLQPLPEAGAVEENWLTQDVTEVEPVATDPLLAASPIDPYAAYAPELTALDDELQHDLHSAEVLG